MIKKALAILSVFSLAFSFVACGKLEKDQKEVPDYAKETDIFITDKAGNTLPAVTKLDDAGNIFYEATDTDGNKVTEKDVSNVIGVTKYSQEELKEKLEELSKEYESNPDAIYEKEDVDFVLGDKVVPDNKLVKTEVSLDENGKPIRPNAKQYEEMFKGDSFSFKVNVKSVMGSEEIETPLAWYKNGNNMLVEATGPFDGSGNLIKAGFLYKDNKCYMIMPSMKVYYEIPEEMAEQMFSPEMFEGMIDSAEAEGDSVYQASYNVNLNGATYVCDVFNSKDGKKTTKNYYDSKGSLVRVEMISGEDLTIWEISELSDKADPSLFTIPSKFINVTAFAGDY